MSRNEDLVGFRLAAHVKDRIHQTTIEKGGNNISPREKNRKEGKRKENGGRRSKREGKRRRGRKRKEKRREKGKSRWWKK